MEDKKMYKAATKTETVTLYRAVQPAELIDIQKTGILRNLGSAEGKYFTTSPTAASWEKEKLKPE